MLFKNTILDNLNHPPTNCQIIAIEKLIEFLENKDSLSIFVMKGYAGTGKTSLISSFIKTSSILQKSPILLAPTGRAAKVLFAYSGKPANTIHKQIYRKKNTKDIQGRFVLDYTKYKDRIFVVDEASMISNEDSGTGLFGSGRLLEDLLQYIYYNNEGCKLILVGDTAQLPPVGRLLSPALDRDYLESLAYKVFTAELSEVVRQADESGILANANILRQNISRNDCSGFPKLNIVKYEDISEVSGNELIDRIEDSVSKFGLEETKILTRSNKFANKYNQGIRSRILWKEEELSAGDLIMVVKNSYSWLEENSPMSFIANGDILEVRRVISRKEIYGHSYADINAVFIDYPDYEIEARVLLDSINVDGPAMPEDYLQKLYAEISLDYSDIEDANKRHEKILEDKYFNALQIKFAYAVTCHKAQGGQWKSVFIDYGWLRSEMIDCDFYRWLYTAITRATDSIHLVNFDKEFF